MADDSDQIPLHAYVHNRCEASFSELVHRHVDLIHSTALQYATGVERVGGPVGLQ